MKRKLIFLCVTLAFFTSLGSTTKERITKTNEITNETNAGWKQDRLDAKVMPTIYVDCPFCGRPTTINRFDSVHLCDYCRRDLCAPSYKKNCPWCERDNVIPVGETLEACRYCQCGFDWATTVSFEASYECNGAESPLIGNKVELFSAQPFLMTNEDGSVSLSQEISTVTDKDGKGSLSITDFSGSTLDVYLRIYASDNDTFQDLKTEWDPHVGYYGLNENYNSWHEGIVKDRSENDYTYKNPYVYRHILLTKGKNNIIPKAVVSFTRYHTYSYNCDSFAMLFYIGQMVMRAKEFSNDCIFTPDAVSVLYTNFEHSKKHKGAFYSETDKTIYLRLDPHNCNPYTIMHEYGHHIQHQKNISKNPGERHAFPENHYRLEEKGLYLAWSESWASTFSTIAQNVCKEKYGKAPNSVTIRNIGFNDCLFGDASYKSYDLESNHMKGGWLYKENENGVYEPEDSSQCSYSGEYCEWTIAQILWDVYDDANEGDDCDYFGIGYSRWFLYTTMPNTFELKDFYDTLIQLENRNENYIKLLFQKHGIYY